MRPKLKAAEPAPLRRPARRTQSERREATRERVLAAAMDTLHAQGYSGATTLAIQKAAGVSMGAMQHQFATKAKLMAAVAERYAELRLQGYEAAVRGARDPRDRMRRLLDAGGAVIGAAEVAASMEIHLARRSDAELDAETAPILRRLEERVRAMLVDAARDAGIRDPARIERLRLLNDAV
ncbi:MAG: TetR family transcriptional regulator, partial [Solimonas sp.]